MDATFKLPAGLRIDSNDAVVIAAGDYFNRRIVQVNAAFARLTGFGQADLVGRHGDLLLADGPLKMESLLWLDTETDGREVHWIARLHRRDGSPFCAEAHLHVLPSAPGSPPLHVLVLADVTSRVGRHDGSNTGSHAIAASHSSGDTVLASRAAR